MEKLVKELKSELVGREYDIIELSNKLYILVGEYVDDICNFGNWEELLNDGNVIIATDEYGEKHIQIYFDVIFKNGDDEMVEATIIKINDIIEY